MTALSIQGEMILFDLNNAGHVRGWTVVDDVVMGGRSDGHFKILSEGWAVFHGTVSLENNGGFSSVRCAFDRTEVSPYQYVELRIKGDGKKYQFRVKTNKYDRHAYIYHFQTTGDWQTVSIPLSEMVPGFRGRTLDMPNYEAEYMEEIAFLIANKKQESFRLEIERISLKYTDDSNHNH